jgi:hypothetical protein
VIKPAAGYRGPLAYSSPEAVQTTGTVAVWVNAKPFQSRLGTDTSFGLLPAEREGNLLNPGDHVLIKLSLAAEKD